MMGFLKTHITRVKFFLVNVAVRIPFIKFKSLDPVRPYYLQKGFKDFWHKHPNNSQSETRLIIYGLRSFAHHNLSVLEQVFSDVLRHNGAHVQNLICDGVLPSCDAATKDVSSETICNACAAQRRYFKQNYAYDVLSFRQFISQDEIEMIRKEADGLSATELQAHHYLGVNVARHAIDSVAYAVKFVFDASKKEHLEKLRESVFIGMLTARVAHHLFEQEKPTHLLTLHGCYASWGPFCEYLFNKGVVVYVYRKLFNLGMGYFDFPKWTDNPNRIPAKDFWNEAKDCPLTDGQKTRLADFLTNKRKRNTPDYKIFYSLKEGQAEERIETILNSDSRKFVMYLHSLWDSGFEDATSRCFQSHAAWINETIEYFRGKKDVYLFVKPHPADLSFLKEHGDKVNDIIISQDRFPENVILLKSDAHYTSFEMIDHGCIGITYYGTVGLEHAYFKIPVLFAGNIHFTDAGAAYKIKSKEEYFQLIDNPQPLFEYPLTHYELIERYAYHYYFRLNLRVPFFREDVFSTDHCIDWKVLADYENFITRDPVMNHIARSIIQKKDVVSLE